MANNDKNFKVKNGLDVKGSATVDNDLLVSGTLTAQVNTPTQDSDVVNKAYVDTAVADTHDSAAVLGQINATVNQTFIDQFDTHDSAAVQGQIDATIALTDTHDSAAVVNQIEREVDLAFINALDASATNLDSDLIPGLVLGTDVNGNYVADVSGTANQIEVTHTQGEGSTPVIGLPNNVTIDSDLTVNGVIKGPATMIIDPALHGDSSGTLVILGNLQVDGVSTVIQSSTVSITDKNIVLADSATNATEANGAGITVNGANAAITYVASGDKWELNKAPYYLNDRLLTTADDTHDSAAVVGQIDSAATSYTLDFVTANGNTTTNNIEVGTINGLQVDRGNGNDATSTAVGANALINVNTGTLRNTALGQDAMANATTGGYNTAIGQAAMGNGVVTGSNNTALGADSLKVLTDGSNNMSIGRSSMAQNTTGSHNTAVGKSALSKNTTGSYNTVLGSNALSVSSSGAVSNNVAIGSYALQNLNPGQNNNIAIGYFAGRDLDSGIKNIIIGADAEASSTNMSNEITLGDDGNKSLRIPGSQFYINGGSEGTTGSKVGIGTSTPTAQLDVTGEVFVNVLTPSTDSALATKKYVDSAVNARTDQDLFTTSDVEFNKVTSNLVGSVHFTAQNDEGTALAIGDVVYIKGISGNTPTVAKADADDATKMPAFGIVSNGANNGANVTVTTFGEIANIDTSTLSLGDTLYVATVAGAFTATKPTGQSSLLQNVGQVTRVHASTGSIKVLGAGRTAATPNLDQNNIFIGNVSNQAITMSIDSAVGLVDTHDSAAVLGQINDTVDVAFINALTSQPDFDSDLIPVLELGTDTKGNYVTDISGTTNEIEVDQSTGSVTVGLPNDVTVSGNLTVGGYIAGPTTLTIDPATVGTDSGTLVILGNLQVEGDTTTINSTTVTISDKNIVLADSAQNPSQANDAGITVNGSNATMQYKSIGDKWEFNKPLFHGADRVLTTSDDTHDSAAVQGQFDSAIADTFNDTVTITKHSTTDPVLKLQSTVSTSDAAPIMEFVRNTDQANNGDYLGQIKFLGEDGSGTTDGSGIVYAKMTGKISDPTDGTEDGLIEYMVKSNGSNLIMARMTGNNGGKLIMENGAGIEVVSGNITVAGNTVLTTASDTHDSAAVVGQINSAATSYTLDFVTTNGNTTTNDITIGTVTADGLTVDTDTLHVDATNDRVGIGTSSPSAALDVAGEAHADSDFFTDDVPMRARTFAMSMMYGV